LWYKTYCHYEANNKYKERYMKKRTSSVIVLNTVFTMLVLAGCDDALNGDGNWLAEEKNPFIGTWQADSTNMSGVTTTTKREFKTDGTIAVTTTQGGNVPTSSTVYYLVKDNFLIVSTTSGSFYTKYKFEVVDNNTIKLKQDGGGTTVYNRSGDENNGVARTTVLSKGLNAAYRATTPSGMAHYVDGDNGDSVDGEPSNNMYNWYLFSTDGTFSFDHYMNKESHYINRGKYSYYIDASNHLVTLSTEYTVTVYYDFTPSPNTTAAPDTFTWKTTSTSDATVSYSKFDGETFWHPGSTAEETGTDHHM
jgi:hypothetical protein